MVTTTAERGLFFFRRFLRNPREVGALCPSTRHLAATMVRGLDLPGDVSGLLRARLDRNADDSVLQLTEQRAGEARAAARAAARDMARRLGGWTHVVLPMATQYSRIGAGNHLGCAFPMRESPQGPADSDQIGRPAGWRRIHVVDSTVFPSIPATTVALLIMANADRIAREMDLAA